MGNTISELASIYSKEKIAASNFCCTNRAYCQNAMQGIDLFRGRAAFVGSQYAGNNRIAIVAMDVGNTPPESLGGILQEMETRRKTIEESPPTNPHLRGTTIFLRLLLNDLGQSFDNPLSHCAIVNAAKCSRQRSADAVAEYLYIKCLPYLQQEIKVLMPSIIWIQGSKLFNILKSQGAIENHCETKSYSGHGTEVLLFEGVPTIKTWHPSFLSRKKISFEDEVYRKAISDLGLLAKRR